MVIDIYFLLIILCVSFVVIGYQYDSEVLRMIGFTILFFIGILVLTDDVSYVSGSTIDTINTTQTIVTKNYTTYQNTTIGFLLATIGFISFVLTFFELRNSFKRGG